MAIPAASASIGSEENTLSMLSCSPSNASPEAPVFVMIVSYPASSSLNAAILAVPIPVIAAVTGRSFFPSAVDFSPIFPAASPTFSSAEFPLSAASFRFFNSASVFITSLCNALYCSSDTSPRSNCCCTCSSAFFKTSSFSEVAETASFRRVCFCANNSVFFGSSFRAFSTSFNSF